MKLKTISLILFAICIGAGILFLRQPHSSSSLNSPTNRFIKGNQGQYQTDPKNPLQAKISTTKQGGTVSLEYQNATVNFDLPYATQQLSSSTENQVSFGSAKTDIEVKYVITQTEIKEEIILHQPSKSTSFVTPLTISNTTLSMSSQNLPIFSNPKTQEPLLKVETPFATDAKGVVTYNLNYRIDEVQGKRNLILEVDPAWLNAPDRVYPVVIDPTVTIISNNYLPNFTKLSDTTPELRFSATDAENDDLVYQIQWDTDSSFPGPTAKTSGTDAGFSNITTPADTSPFNQGNTIAYTFQSALTNGTTYFYQVRSKDPGGSNVYTAWSTTRSFTIDTSLTSIAWFQTHADQFSQNTNSGNITVDNANNLIERTAASSDMPGYEYRRPVTITNNTGSSQTNYDVVFTFDTATLIAAGKMQSDCDDLRVTASDYTTLRAYWIEGGCNTTTTQVWVQIPSLPTGNTTLYAYYGNAAAANAEQSWSGYFTLLNNASCPSGWTRNTVFDGLFPEGATTNGTTGGTTTHDHADWSGSTNSGGNTTKKLAGGASNVEGAGHSHTITINTSTITALLPPYLDMVFCQKTKLDISSGLISLFDISTPTGWTQFSALDGKFPRGASSYGGTGGTDTHIHTTAAATTGTSASSTSDTGTNSSGSTRSHAVPAQDITAANNDPPYLDMVYASANSPTTGATGTIALADAVPPLGWTRFSTLDSKFPRGAATYGGTGGATTHHHDVSISTSNNTSVSRNAGALNRSSIHSHTITYTTDEQSNLPPFITTQFIKRKDPNNTYSVGSESTISDSATTVSPAITAAHFSATATHWDKLVVNMDLTYGTAKYQFYYDVTGTPTIIPDSVLSGNSSGFTNATTSISALTTAAYPILYVKASIYYNGGSPKLNDWKVNWNTKTNLPTLDSLADGTTHAAISPVLKTTATDDDGDYLRYKIELCTDSGMTANCQTFNQTSSQTGWSGQNTQTSTAYTSGTQATYTVQTPLNPGTTYYWRSYASDPGALNLWSNTQVTPYSFTTNSIPNTPTLDAPTNGATNQSILPLMKTTATDADSDYLRYKIQICTDSGMTVACQTFDQTSSQTGWSNQNTQSNTAYTSGRQAIYTPQTNLTAGMTYYWKSWAYDAVGSYSWGTTQSTPYSFTVVAPPADAAQCVNIVKNAANDQITLNWADIATTESAYEIERSVDGAAFSLRYTTAASATTYADSITINHRYAYRIRARLTDIEGHYVYSTNYCTTITLDIETSDVGLTGLKLQGLQIK